MHWFTAGRPTPTSWIRLTYLSGGRFHDGRTEVILGDLLADDLKKKAGDTLPIQGKVFTVVGIFHGGTALEDGAVIMPLDQMQNISSMEGKVTAFHVKLHPVPDGMSYDDYVKRAAERNRSGRAGCPCRSCGRPRSQ